MKKIQRWLALGCFAALIGSGPALTAQDLGQPAHADAVKLPLPAEVRELRAYPTSFTMVGADESRQLVVTGATAERLQDLSGAVQYVVAPAGVVRVSSSGLIFPVANGEAVITARYG